MRMLKKVVLPLILVVTIFATTLTAFAADSSPSGKAFGEGSLEKTVVTYEARARHPKVTLYDTDGNLLVKNKDYTVTYQNDTNVGTGKAIIKGKGVYAGQKMTLTFKINPAKPWAAVNEKTKHFVRKSKVKSSNYEIGTVKYYFHKTFLRAVPKNAVKTALSTTASKAIKISNGKIYVLKGAKTGTYYVTVKFNKSSDGNYAAVTRTIKIVVK